MVATQLAQVMPVIGKIICFFPAIARLFLFRLFGWVINLF